MLKRPPSFLNDAIEVPGGAVAAADVGAIGVFSEDGDTAGDSTALLLLLVNDLSDLSESVRQSLSDQLLKLLTLRASVVSSSAARSVGRGGSFMPPVS